MERFSTLLIAAAVVALLALAGCGETVIDDVKMEDTLQHELQTNGKGVSSVDCPSDVKVETGTTFECTVHLADGKTETATLKIRNQDADVDLLRIGS